MAFLMTLAACGAINTTPRHRPLLITLDGRAHSDTIHVDTRRLARLPRQAGMEMAYHPSSSYAAYGAAVDSAVTMLRVEQTPFMDGVDASEVTINPGQPADAGVPDARRPDLPGSACRHVSAFVLPGEAPPRYPAYLSVSSGGEKQTLRVDPRRAMIRARPLLTLDSAGLARRPGFHIVFRRPREGSAHPPMLRLQVLRLHGRRWVHLEPVRFGARVYPMLPRAALASDAEWRLYLLEDPARRWSRCRARPPVDQKEYESAEDVVRRYAEQRIAERIDSVVALYRVPPLRSAKLRRGEREIRLTTGGGMIYSADYVIRIRERRGRVRGEVYEWWSRVPSRPEFAGGPYNMEWRDPRPRGCRSPRITATRWVCRLEPPIPIDWTRFAARLDSLAAWRLPPQQDRSAWTDQTALLVASHDRGEYRIADYYGASERSQFASSRAADEVAEMISRIFGPQWRTPPDSVGWSKAVPGSSISVPRVTAFLVRDAATWKRLWSAFPLRGKVPRARRPPSIDFAREQLLVIGTGLDKSDCPIAPDLARVEVRGDIRYLLIEERPMRWRETPFGGKPQQICANDPAPVLIVRIGRSGQTVLADYRSGLVFPQLAPKWARTPSAAK